MAPGRKKGRRLSATFAFWDEAGISDRPLVRKTWAPTGETPIIRVPGHWRTRSVTGVVLVRARTRRSRLLLRVHRETVRAPVVRRMLRELRRHTRGRVILLWDRLPAHRAGAVQRQLRAQRTWLTTVWFPPYAPELNPVEHVWSALKRTDLGNRVPDTLDDLARHARQGARRISKRPQVLHGCLRASGLFPHF